MAKVEDLSGFMYIFASSQFKTTAMKRIITILALFVCLPLMSSADNDYVIPFEQLPQVSQTFVQTHFSGVNVSFTMRDSHSFEVRFEDGSEVEFDKKGNWKEVDCKRQAVPASVLSLVPAEIQTYAAATFPQATITKINQKHWGYEVELSNGFDLEFNKKGKFLRMDD